MDFREKVKSFILDVYQFKNVFSCKNKIKNKIQGSSVSFSRITSPEVCNSELVSCTPLSLGSHVPSVFPVANLTVESFTLFSVCPGHLQVSTIPAP